MLTVEAWTTIRYLHAQGMGIRAICRELSVSRKAVRHALRQEGVPRYQRAKRANPKLVGYEERIRELFQERHLIGSRILREMRALGYAGGQTALYAYLRTLKAPASKATERFETAPGQQAPFDWSPYTIPLGEQTRRVIVYGMTLGYSRRKHYTASLDETQPSIFEAIEACWRHFGGATKELLVDNPKAFVVDANPASFAWNALFVEWCGHYRVQPRACQVRRPQTKGKHPEGTRRPFFYLEQQFIKDRQFRDFAHFLEALAAFEQNDLDVRIHTTTKEAPLERFAKEQPALTPLPATAFVPTTALTRKVSADCLVSYRGSRYSAPWAYAGALVWVLPSQGVRVRLLDERHTLIAEHDLSQTPGAIIAVPEHYAGLRQQPPRTLAVLSQTFRTRFPDQGAVLADLLAHCPKNPVPPLQALVALADLYDAASMRQALAIAQEYHTYAPAFLRGLLQPQHPAQPALGATPTPLVLLPVTRVQCDLSVYQRLLEA
jgi:transposase